MREILFKGKTALIVGTYNLGKEDGEWVVGQLYCDVGKWVIRQFEFDRADYVGYEVDPETVCQYTGLTDKNGKKIFEGDIVKAGEILAVSWKEKLASWCLCKKGWMYNHFFGEAVNAEDCEVIGNIFENPDLLTTSPTDSD